MDDRKLLITFEADWKAAWCTPVAGGENECAVLNFESVETLLQLLESWRWEVLRKARERLVPAGALPLIAGHLKALEQLGLVELDDAGEPYCHYRCIDIAPTALDALATELIRHPERLNGLDARLASRLQERARELSPSCTRSPGAC